MRAFALIAALVATASASPLWDYVHTFDPNYSYYDTGARIGGNSTGWTGYVLNMTSQQWFDSTVSDRPIWTHQLVVIVPDNVRYTTSAGLYVTGNCNDNPGVPSELDEDILVAAVLATTNGVITATLFQIPNCPIVFTSDPSHQGRSEDALVAWTWKLYMTGEYPPEIVAYFPMVKATVRALDTIEDFAKKQFGYDVSSHLVAGASKRGWDTWLTGAVDTRITAIAPIVMDMLNFTQNVMHMYEAYGGWTFAFVDYWNANVTVTLGMNQTAINLLANVIDPLVYKENLTMPKLVIDATGDEFFMPDDDWFWWGDLEGETNRLMIANAEHSEATGLLTLLPGACAFFEGVLSNTPRPSFTWSMDPVSGDISIITKTKPTDVILRFATTFDATRRDFRLVKGNTPTDPCEFIPVKIFGNACINPVLWSSESVAPTSVDNGVYTYVLSQPLPPSGWRAFLGELHYPGPNGQEYIMTTQIPTQTSKVVAPANPATGSGPVYRNAKFADKLHDTCFEDVRTLYDAFQRGARISAKRNCMGYRPAESVGSDGKVTKYGNYTWFSYEDCVAMRDAVGAAIEHENMAPAGPDGIRFVGLFSKNRYEWVIAEQACNAFGIATVPLYDTLGAEAVAYILNQTQLTTVFVERTEFQILLNAKKSTPSIALANVVLFESANEEEVKLAAAEGVRLRSFADVVSTGKANPRAHTPPAPDQLATICYTSGTTGDPKGVMLSHRNIIADVSGAILCGLKVSDTDVHLSYLPLAHMFERVVQVALWSAGCQVGFYQGSPLKLMEDIAVLRPTMFPSVPRLFNRIYDKLMAAIETTPGIKGKMLRKAYATKKANLRKNILTHPFWDKKVFSKVAARVGMERVRLMITGSAPIAAHVMDFLRIVFSCDLFEGYGQTECAAAASLTMREDVTNIGHVGVPLACNEIKLVSVEDMGYRYDDTFHGRQLNADGSVAVKGEECNGRGEVCFRGPNVFAGYYKSPDKTAEALDADGWLHSGDIGMWTPQGYLRIVDRKKNIFKLSQGEYVAAEKIENVYVGSPLVAQVFVYGDSLQAVLVGIVVPDEEQVKKWAADNNISGSSLADWVKNPALKAAVQKDMDRVAKEGKLKGFEMVKDIRLEATLFSVENDLLTPTFKLKRNVAKQRYQALIDEMYAGGLGVVAGMTGLKQGATTTGGKAVPVAGVEESKSPA